MFVIQLIKINGLIKIHELKSIKRAKLRYLPSFFLMEHTDKWLSFLGSTQPNIGFISSAVVEGTTISATMIYIH